MKKIMIALGLLCMALGVMAQQERLTIKKVEKGKEPQEVMSAIKQDFPEGVVQELSFLPSKLYGEEWNVNVEGNQGVPADFYQVSVREGDRHYTAVYDKEGRVISSKEVIHHRPLPPAVAETLKKFSGWHIDQKHEIVKYRKQKSSDIYRVKIQKGGEHKIVYLDANGNIINSRFAPI